VNALEVAIRVLLYLGVACQLVCCIGVLVMRGPFDKLHYAAAGSTLGPVLLGTALVLRETVQTSGAIEVNAAAWDTIATVALLFFLNPALCVATARAARRIDFGSVKPLPEERTGEER